MNFLKKFFDKLCQILLVIGGLMWGYMAWVSIIDPYNNEDLDDVFIYGPFVWWKRALLVLIVISALYQLVSWFLLWLRNHKVEMPKV